MRRFLTVLISLFVLLSFFSNPAQAQSAVEVTDIFADYEFGEWVLFEATLQPPSAIREAYLFFQAEGDTYTHTVPLTLSENGHVTYQHNIPSGPLRPFARIFFWFKMVLASGETVDSQSYYIEYTDDRYPWQTLEGETVRVHWYAGDMTFGQASLDTARAGMQAVESLLSTTATSPVDIYLYASVADVQDALGLGGYSWVAGHASPDLGVVLVSIAPGETQAIEMERQIPHELAHVMLYRKLGQAYANLPTWLSEGIASLAEQYPNADYTQVLTVSAENDALIDIASLCGPFPADASGAILAYAESASFTRYLYDTYGTSGLQNMVSAYADGLTCEQGTQRAIGLPLTQLDLHWRQASLGENVSSVAFQNLLPYMAILLLILIIPAWRLGLNLQKAEGQQQEEQQQNEQ